MKPSCKKWVQRCQANCRKPDDDREVHVRIHDVLRIGNQVSHHSHKLYRFEALIFCRKCGCYAGGKRLVYLAKPCTQHPTDAGLQVLEDIAAGVMPGSKLECPPSELEG